MKKILSDKQCDSLIEKVQSQEWERVDYHCHYDQSFVEDVEVEKTFEDFFGKKFSSRPIMKILKLSKGDSLPLYSGDYDSVTDDRFNRYKGTNFIIECFLNDDFEGGNISLIKETFTPLKGHGITQKRSNICSISEVTNGTCYIIFCYIKGYVSSNLL